MVGCRLPLSDYVGPRNRRIPSLDFGSYRVSPRLGTVPAAAWRTLQRAAATFRSPSGRRHAEACATTAARLSLYYADLKGERPEPGASTVT
jgi:hypothetical protein